MKKLNLILSAVVLTLTSFGQSHLQLVRERVGDKAILENWNVGEAKEVNDVKILRVEGENGIDYRTNVFYIPQGKLLAEINQMAAIEPVYNKDLEELTDFYTNEFPGGQVAIFFDRLSQELANPGNFTVLIIDPETNKEIYSTRLERQMPYSYKWGIWYYYTVINIPHKLNEKFTVRILDEGLQESSEFLVYDNFPPAQLPASVVSVRK